MIPFFLPSLLVIYSSVAIRSFRKKLQIVWNGVTCIFRHAVFQYEDKLFCVSVIIHIKTKIYLKHKVSEYKRCNAYLASILFSKDFPRKSRQTINVWLARQDINEFNVETSRKLKARKVLWNFSETIFACSMVPFIQYIVCSVYALNIQIICHEKSNFNLL